MKPSILKKISTSLFVATILFGSGQLAAQTVVVYKSPSCGCCKGWVDYLRDNDVEVETHDLTNLDSIKKQYGIDPSLQSCHTAIVDGYVVEGHVPIDDIQQLIEEKPDIVGISAPGMPPMSPGMNSIVPKNYSVMSFDREGKQEVFSKY